MVRKRAGARHSFATPKAAASRSFLAVKNSRSAVAISGAFPKQAW
jgi:hypothetical protein